MPTIIMGPFTPTTYEAWRVFHYERLNTMKAAGTVSDRICRPVGDPDKLVVVQEVEDPERFIAFVASPELEATRTATPVDGEYNVLVLEEIERPS
ncbi:MAG: hypothetical protein ACSLFM_08180 [Tepidiformaceae bacterium]